MEMVFFVFIIFVSIIMAYGIAINFRERHQNIVADQNEELEDEVAHSQMLRDALLQYNPKGLPFNYLPNGRKQLMASVEQTAAFVDPEAKIITPKKIISAVNGLKAVHFEGLYRIRFDFGSVSTPSTLDVFETEGVQLVLDYDNDMPVYVQFPIKEGSRPTKEEMEKVCSVLMDMSTPWGAFVAIPIRQFSSEVVSKKKTTIPRTQTTGTASLSIGDTSATSIVFETPDWTFAAPNASASLTKEELELLENVLTEGVTQWGGGEDVLAALKIVWNLRKS